MVHTRQLRQRWCWTSGSVRGPRLIPVTDLHWYHFCEPITEFSAIPWCHHRFGVKGPWSLHRILWDQVGIFTLELSWFFQGHGAEAFWMLINWSYFSRSLSLSLSQTYFLCLCQTHTHTHTHTSQTTQRDAKALANDGSSQLWLYMLSDGLSVS